MPLQVGRSSCQVCVREAVATIACGNLGGGERGRAEGSFPGRRYSPRAPGCTPGWGHRSRSLTSSRGVNSERAPAGHRQQPGDCKQGPSSSLCSPAVSPLVLTNPPPPPHPSPEPGSLHSLLLQPKEACVKPGEGSPRRRKNEVKKRKVPLPHLEFQPQLTQVIIY